jgi:hypothetical protein
MLLENSVDAYGITAVESRYDPAAPADVAPDEGFRYRTTLRSLRAGDERLIEFTADTDSFGLYLDLLNRERQCLGLRGAAWVIADQQCKDLSDFCEF